MKILSTWWWFLHLATAVLLSTPAVAHICGEGKIYDITHRLMQGMPAFGSVNGTGQIVNETRGNESYYGTIKLNTHMGTHVDSPGHFFQDLYEAGFDVDSLNLQTLNGPALVIDTPRDKNITAEVLKSLNIPSGLKRVIFRTQNTDRGLMKRRAFEPNYTGFTSDGAEWLVNHTQIKFVGIDYLSIAIKDEAVKVHQILLRTKNIIPVECLKLDEINPGYYTVHCLPLRLPLADGSPARCILIQ